MMYPNPFALPVVVLSPLNAIASPGVPAAQPLKNASLDCSLVTGAANVASPPGMGNRAAAGRPPVVPTVLGGGGGGYCTVGLRERYPAWGWPVNWCS